MDVEFQDFLRDHVIGKAESEEIDLLEQLYFGKIKDPALVRGIAVHLLLQNVELCKRIGSMESHIDDMAHCKRNICAECEACLRALEDVINQ